MLNQFVNLTKIVEVVVVCRMSQHKNPVSLVVVLRHSHGHAAAAAGRIGGQGRQVDPGRAALLPLLPLQGREPGLLAANAKAPILVETL